MKTNKKVVKKTVVSSISILLIVIVGVVLGNQKNGNLTINENEIVSLPTESTQDQKSDFDNFEKETKGKVDFIYKQFVIGGTSSGIVAEIDGVDHLFLWGNNGQGQLGIGNYVDGWSLENAYEESNDIIKNLLSSNFSGDSIANASNISTPEDVNVDGGESGIQGKILDVQMAEATTFVAIENENNYVDIYATGYNGYGLLGTGYDSQFYSTEFQKMNFIDSNGDNVIWNSDEYFRLFAKEKSAFITGIDQNGKKRIFAWGLNNVGQLGMGFSGNGEPAANSEASGLVNTDFVATPFEITNQFDFPTYEGGEVKPSYEYGVDEIWYDSNPESIDVWEGGEGPQNWNSNFDTTDPSTYQLDASYTYPFETEKLNDGDWYIDDILIDKQVVYLAKNDTLNKTAMFTSGNQGDLTTGNLTKEFVETGGKWNNGTYSLLPALYFWDGMTLEEFLSPQPFGDNDVIEETGEIIFKSWAQTYYGIEYIFNIDGRDRAFLVAREFPSGDNDELKNYAPSGNSLNKFQTGKMNTLSGIWEVNMLFDEYEVIDTFGGEDSYHNIIKTTGKVTGKDIYSIISWGVNRGGTVDPLGEIPSQDYYDYNSGGLTPNYHTTRLSATTAESFDDLGFSSTVKYGGDGEEALDVGTELNETNWETFSETGRTIGGFRIVNPDYISESSTPEMEEYISISDYLGDDYENWEFSFDSASSGKMHTMLNVTGTNGDSTIEKSFYYGSNESQQISSSLEEQNVIAPISFKIASPALTDSFKLNYETVTSQGIDFSIDVVHGGEIEFFVPEFDVENVENNSIRLFGDVNGDGETIVYDSSNLEEIGVGITTSYGNSGNLEYIGRGSTNKSGDDSLPVYNMDDISYEDQKNSTYIETYNFRITGLESGVSFSNLFVSINGHNPIKVDGILQTEQKVKYTTDTKHMEIGTVSDDYFKFKTELMYNIPGYDSLNGDVEQNLTKEEIAENTTIYFESIDSENNITSYSNNKELTSSTNEIILEIENVGEPGDSEQDISMGETPIGQDVNMIIYGDSIEPNTLFTNFSLFYNDGENTSIWETPDDYSAMTNLDENFEIKTYSQFVLGNSFTNVIEPTETTAKFSMDIKSGEDVDGINYTEINPESVVVTADESINNGEIKNVTLTSEMSIESNTQATISLTNLQPNAKYSNIIITASDDDDNEYHTSYTTSSEENSEFILSTNALEPSIEDVEVDDEPELLSDTTVGIVISVLENNSNPNYDVFDPENDVKLINDDSGKTIEYISSDGVVDDKSNYTYKISGFHPNETLSGASISIDGITHTLPDLTTLKTDLLLSDEISIDQSLENTKSEIEITFKTTIDYEKGGILSDYNELEDDVRVNITSEIKDGDSNTKDYSATKENYEDNENNTERTYLYKISDLPSNATITINSLTMGEQTIKPDEDTSSIITNTEALDPIINADSDIKIVNETKTSSSFAIEGIEITSHINNSEYSEITLATLEITGTNKVDQTKVVSGTSVIEGEQDTYLFEFNDLDANSIFTSATLTLDTGASKEFTLSNVNTLANSIDLNGIGSTATTNSESFSLKIEDSILKENLEIPDTELFLGFIDNDDNISTGSINSSDMPIEDGFVLSAKYKNEELDAKTDDAIFFEEVTSEVKYNQETGFITIKLSGLKAGAEYKLEQLKLTDDGSDNVDKTSQQHELSDVDSVPVIDTNTTPFPWNDVVLEEPIYDNVTYLDSEMTVHTTLPTSIIDSTEVLNLENFNSIKDENGNEYIIKEITPNSEVENKYNIVFDVPNELIGKTIIFTQIVYLDTSFDITSSPIKTIKHFNVNTDTDFNSIITNADSIKNTDQQLEITLKTIDGYEFDDVNFYSVTINGEIYNLTPKNTKIENTYIVNEFNAIDGELILTAINGQTIEEQKIGTITLTIEKISTFWFVIIAILLLLLIIGIILLLLKYLNKWKISESKDISEKKVSFYLNKKGEENLLILKNKDLLSNLGKLKYLASLDDERILIKITEIKNFANVKKLNDLVFINNEKKEFIKEKNSKELKIYKNKLENWEKSDKLKPKPRKPKLQKFTKNIKVSGNVILKINETEN